MAILCVVVGSFADRSEAKARTSGKVANGCAVSNFGPTTSFGFWEKQATTTTPTLAEERFSYR